VPDDGLYLLKQVAQCYVTWKCCVKRCVAVIQNNTTGCIRIKLEE